MQSALPPLTHVSPHSPPPRPDPAPDAADLFPAVRSAVPPSLERALRNNLHVRSFVERRFGDLEQAYHRGKNPRAKSVLRSVLLCSSLRIILMRDASAFHARALQCRKHLCPLCALDWAAHLRIALSKAVSALGPNPSLRHLVLTCPSCPADRLGETITRLYKAIRLWREYGRRPHTGKYLGDVVGLCAKTEVAAGRIPGHLHPHVHMLLHIRPGGFFDWRRESDARFWWQSHAQACLGNRCEISWISTPRDEAGAVIELAKYAGKGVLCGTFSIDALYALAIGLYGRRMVQSSGTLRVRVHPATEATSLSLGTSATVFSRARGGSDFETRQLMTWALYCTRDQLRGTPEHPLIESFLRLPYARALLAPILQSAHPPTLKKE